MRQPHIWSSVYLEKLRCNSKLPIESQQNVVWNSLNNLKPFYLLCKKLKCQRMFICKCEIFCHLNTFDVCGDKFNPNQFTDRPVHFLQVCKAFLIELALSKWQKVFQIKCQKLFTFASLYLLTFRLLSYIALQCTVTFYEYKCLEDLTTFFMSTWWGDSQNMKEIEFSWWLFCIICKIAQPIQPIWEHIFALP